MDFGSVLYKAQTNEQNFKQNKNYYKTSFSPPKKEQKEKKLSVNIQKFLARKEEEEKQKKFEAERKKQELLALRNKDKKSFKRVQSMLKRTKSANKSVIEDAIDNVNTAITACGPLQPDEDDYGYVSKDASDLYNKLIKKYSNMPPEEPKFSKSSIKSSKDILNTKDRVKNALQREEEEKLLPRKRKRKNKNENGEENEKNSDNDEERTKEKIINANNDEKSKKSEKFKIPKKNAQQTPPLDFQSLLKLAEQKQYEPIMIEKKVDDKPDRPMTEKEKQEYLREHSRKSKRDISDTNSSMKNNDFLRKADAKMKNELKEKRSKHLNENRSRFNTNNLSSTSLTGVSKSENQTKKIQQKIPDVMEKESLSFKNRPVQNPNDLKKFKIGDVSKELKRTNPSTSKPKSFHPERCQVTLEHKNETSPLIKKPNTITTNNVKSNHNESVFTNQKQKILDKKTVNVSPNSSSKFMNVNTKSSKLPYNNNQNNKIIESKKSEGIRQFPPNDFIRYEKTGDTKKESLNLKLDSIRQFPPPDVRRKPKQLIMRKKIIESDEEYDSEMDDFIDDSEDTNDVSKYITEIFGYDRSRYSRMDEDDDECMESNFSQLQKEEFISTKYGILEDLADVRRTKMEKEQKKKRLILRS